MDAKQTLICQMAATVMTKVMTNSVEQNNAYAMQAVKAAVAIYDIVDTTVKAAVVKIP